MENEEKKCLTDEKECNEIVNVDEKDVVQSCAIIRQAEAAPLVPYQRLQLNTDLNLPPLNWLYGKDSFRFINTVPSNSSEYSSFRIALQNIDLIGDGDVDVVSWAQNVKTLLKIPYNPNAQVSLMLHKVGNTLLIDDFDLNLLLRNSDFHWEWFRKFFFDKIYNSFKENQKVLRPNKSRNVVINRNLLSKFLYYSFGESISPNSSTGQTVLDEKGFSLNQSVTERSVLEPPISNVLPNNEEPTFDRHVIWNFENIKMLIGTDLPIFEGNDNLCISLRLNDISKPINVLTGLDYWLDNLMCNVPEIAMCYHFQGLVKEYDFLKTEDVPNLPDSKFSPKEVLDVAQNILSFLKSKATKEGHTYWLFKAKDDLYVKLYDLTSLSDEPAEFCISPEGKSSQSHSANSKNPFILPVAMLCYKVAERLSSCNCSSLHAQICSLLINTLKLLTPEKYPKICCAANCLLSDAYLPKELDPQSPHLSDVSDDEECLPKRKSETKRKKKESKKIKTKEGMKSIENVHVEFLSRPYNKDDLPEEDFADPPSLDKDINVRCEQARNCVITAFKCMEEKKASKDFEKQQNINPNEPIPMPYAPLNKGSDERDGHETLKEPDKILSSDDCRLTLSALGSDCTRFSWVEKITILLLQKIYLICLIEAKLACRKKRCGYALKYVNLALHSVKCIETTAPEHKFNSPFDAYLMAGDAYYELACDFDNIECHLNEFTIMDEKYSALKQRLDYICNEGNELVKEMPTEIIECFLSSEKCFSRVLNSEENRITSSMKFKWAFLCHDLGTYYMQKNQEICKKYNKGMEETTFLYENAEKYFNECRKCYDELKNYLQLSCLKLNIGHFYRLCAFYHSELDQCKKYYIKATVEYKITIRNLGKRGENAEVWDSLNLELVKTLKSHGVLLYNWYSTNQLSKDMEEKISNQIECLFNEAIVICDSEQYRNDPNFQEDSLHIHSFWAKFYFFKRQNRSHADAAKYQKKAEEHFDIVFNYYEKISKPYDCLNIIIDRMELMDGLEKMGKTVWNTSVADMKILTYKGLPLLCKCKQLLEKTIPKEELLALSEHRTQCLTAYYNKLLKALNCLNSSFGQFRQKKKKINRQLIDRLCKKCSKTPIELDSLYAFVDEIKTELLAYI